jgi:hypothetical protein
MEAHRSLVGRPVFKTGGGDEKSPRWVRFPCTSANITSWLNLQNMKIFTPGGIMKKVYVAMLCAAAALALAGCGKPPKDVAQKMALGYIIGKGGEYVELDDIKYLGETSKDGGYLVSIQAGDAQCEMQMNKKDKDWVVKGMNCNGTFLSKEKIAPRKKVMVTKLIQKQAEITKSKEIVNNDGTTGRYTFDGKRYAMVINTQAPAAGLPDAKKKETTEKFVQMMCSQQGFIDAREAGYDTGMELVSKDDKTLLSVTITDKECPQAK